MEDTRKKSHSTAMFFVKGIGDSSYLRPLVSEPTFLEKNKEKGLSGTVFC